MSASSRHFMVAVQDEDREQALQGNEKCRQADPFANMVHTVKKEHEPWGSRQKPTKSRISRPGFRHGTSGRKRIASERFPKDRPECSLRKQPTPGPMLLKNRPSEHGPGGEWSQQNRYCGVAVDVRATCLPSGAHYHQLRQQGAIKPPLIPLEDLRNPIRRKFADHASPQSADESVKIGKHHR